MVAPGEDRSPGNQRKTSFGRMKMHFLLFFGIGIEKMSDKSGVLRRRERAWCTLASLLVGGKLEDHGSLVTSISGDHKLWMGGLFGPYWPLLTLKRRVCSQVKKEETTLVVCKLV